MIEYAMALNIMVVITVRAAVGLQITGDRRPRRPTDRRGDEQQQDHDEPGQVEANPAVVPHEDQGDKGQPDAPEHALSLTADVEQPGVEGCDRHAGKDQGGGVEDRLPDPDLAHEHVGDVELHGLHRVFHDQDDQQPDNEGKDQLQQRRARVVTGWSSRDLLVAMPRSGCGRIHQP